MVRVSWQQKKTSANLHPVFVTIVYNIFNFLHFLRVIASSLHLYILNAVRCPYVRNVRMFVRHAGRDQLSIEWRHNEKDVMRTGAASAVGMRS